MHQVYEDYLFSQGCFVASPQQGDYHQHAAEALVALAHYGEIRIVEHPERADVHMVEVAARNLGCDVPEPFYRGFPQTVRALSPSELAFDQFIHYARTYGLGDFSQAGYSLFEEYYGRSAFEEDVRPRKFAIITEQEAQARIGRAVEGFLASTRPLNEMAYQLVLRSVLDADAEPVACASKDTACRLLLDTHDLAFVDQLSLPDVIRLVEWLLELKYPDMSMNKLNLKNQDRKLIRAVLDCLFEREAGPVRACLEKKRVWNGLLHHIHYRPTCDAARAFCQTMRGHEMRSAYSEFERLVQAGDVRAAADSLHASKGAAAVARNLSYLLSRCSTADDAEYVLNAAATDNKVVLAQLIVHFSQKSAIRRIFKFVHLNKMRVHAETDHEVARRKSRLRDDASLQALTHLQRQFEQACHGTLGAVYVSESLRNTALPLQEAASHGGLGTLPTGTRLPISPDKKLRAFVYWEKVDDIDLSCIALDEQGNAREFSWRTFPFEQEGLDFSGDETSGYEGGSEYFDVDLARFRAVAPTCRYLIFCANMYTRGRTFASCVCRAGSMVRDLQDSGAVFEPKTVQSSFTVNCASSAAHLFALDLRQGYFVWLNVAEQSSRRIAGEGDVTYLLDYMNLPDALSLHDFALCLATTVVHSPEDADVVFSDDELVLRDGQEQVRSCDIARVLELLNG